MLDLSKGSFKFEDLIQVSASTQVAQDLLEDLVPKGWLKIHFKDCRNVTRYKKGKR